MGRTYKRNSRGQFAGGGGFKRVRRAMARIGVKTTANVNAAKTLNKVDHRREVRRTQASMRRAERTGNI